MDSATILRSSAGALLLALTLACGGGSGGGSRSSVTISGVNPYISMDDQPVFTAVVAGQTDTTVTWSLQEGALAGSISATGQYYPTDTEGTYHVQAKSHADPSLVGTAAFQVVRPAWIRSFLADQGVIKPGESVKLSPVFSGGPGTITGLGPVTSEVPVTVAPSVTTTYTLTVQNLAGKTAIASQTVYCSAHSGAFTLMPLEYPQDLYYPAASLLGNGQILVTGGFSLPAGAALKTVHQLDPATGVTQRLADLTEARQAHLQLALNGTKVLLYGSYGTPTLYDTAANDGLGSATSTGLDNYFTMYPASCLLQDGKVLVYSKGYAAIYAPATGTSTATAYLGSALERYMPTLTTLTSGKVLVSGGEQTNTDLALPPALDTAALYDPATGTLTGLTARMTVPRWQHLGVLLEDGTVLIVGGRGADGYPSATAELFDPATNTFTAIPMAFGHWGITATRLLDGNVLVVGRTTNTNPAATNLCELYVTAQKKFVVTAATVKSRSGHTATLAPSGKVVIIGGAVGASPGYSSVEIYDPSY